MREEFRAANELFERELCSFTGANGTLVPLPCRIHECFTGLQNGSHNCIGCNFADGITAIKRVLNRIAASENPGAQFDYSEYLISLYLFAERAYMLFEIVALPDPYKHRHFAVFQEVKRWANFLNIRITSSSYTIRHSRLAELQFPLNGTG